MSEISKEYKIRVLDRSGNYVEDFRENFMNADEAKAKYPGYIIEEVI